MEYAMMDPIEIILREYDTVRSESLNTMSNRFQVVAFGLATLGALTAGVFAFGDRAQNPTFVLLSLNYLIPAISILVLFIWLGEVNRMNRAGLYIYYLEQEMNDYVKNSMKISGISEPEGLKVSIGSIG
jgi:hypothetical protein